MENQESKRITAVWLDSGKKLVVQECLIAEGNFLIRSGPLTVLIVPGAKVQSVETEYGTVEQVEAIFAGEGNR